MVQGAGDSFLLAVHLSSRCPIVVAPAMDLDMFTHPATQENLKTLVDRGVGIIEPESGPLASGLEGKGRMAEPEHIADWMESWFAASAPLHGKKVLITAGPTYEPIDAVRFIGNRSSGKMGYALADAFIRLGAEVTLVSGPVQLSAPEGVHELVKVQTAQEMYNAAVQRFPSADIAVAAAAVADARPVAPTDKKLHKDELPQAIELESTRDILSAWGHSKTSHQTVVGFALETDEGSASAQSKLERKKADFIVLNSTSVPGAGFETDTNQVTIFEKGGNSHTFELKSKAEVANDIVRTLLNSIDS
jgi:phosphopantothenoylcysteine decarboxylase/phosphopantothenate--cysteine ligase